MDILGDEIDTQITVELALAALPLKPTKDHLLGTVHRLDHPAVLPGQSQTLRFGIDTT